MPGMAGYQVLPTLINFEFSQTAIIYRWHCFIMFTATAHCAAVAIQIQNNDKTVLKMYIS